MAKKIIARLTAILIFSAVVFGASYFAGYKITQNKYEADKAADVTAATFADETVPPETQSAAPAETTAAPTQADGTTEAESAPLWDNNVLPEPTVINMPTDETWSLVLLNVFYKMNDTYEPFLKLALDDSAVYLDERVADAFRSMYEAAMNDGVTLTIASGYVSLDRQTRNFTKLVNAYMEQGLTEEQAKGRAAFSVLPTGCSENNYGLAVDLGWLDSSFAASPAYAWLKSNAANYGFIERYVAGKESVTHFNACPWHWRYVGADYAKEIVSSGQCLEEYVGKVN